MAAKAVCVPEEPVAEVGKDIFLLAMPIETYRAISDTAAKRGLTFSQALSQALSQWMTGSSTSQLLLEQREPPP